MKCNIHQKNFPKSINDNKYIAELQEYMILLFQLEIIFILNNMKVLMNKFINLFYECYRNLNLP